MLPATSQAEDVVTFPAPPRERVLLLPLMLCALLALQQRPARAQVQPTLPENLPQGWYAHIETSKGAILARLLPEQAPQAVAHFAALAEGRFSWVDPVTGQTEKSPYYDGIPVNRAQAGALFEAGATRGEGKGVPQLYVALDGLAPVNFGRPGRLGMARASSGGISGVRFFVTASGQPWLNGNHPCFGEVVTGLDVVSRISDVKTYSNGRPTEPIMIDRIRILPVGDPPPLQEPELYVPKLVRPTLRDGSRQP